MACFSPLHSLDAFYNALVMITTADSRPLFASTGSACIRAFKLLK
jgi:hypothetical protein